MTVSFALALFCSTILIAFSTAMAHNTRTRGVVDIRENEEEVAKVLAHYVANLSNKFSKERNKFTIVVAGSKLIETMRKLTQEPYCDSINWSAWHMFWVDERLVPLTHNESNYKKCYDDFLSKVPIPTANIHVVNTTLPGDDAANDYEARIKELVNKGIVDFSKTTGFPQFDLMLLGMGTDGHIASLFPGHPLLEEKHRWVASLNNAPYEPRQRVTFTLPVINSAANFAFVINTYIKTPEFIINAYENMVPKAMESDGQEKGLLPVQMVSPQGQLNWFLDTKTAAKL